MSIGSPIGSTPFGVGTPAVSQAPPETHLRNAAFIDYRERDYVFDSEGELERMPVTRQRVLLALATRRGSSSIMPEFGLALPARIDSSFNERAQQAVLDALSHLVGTAIEIEEIRVDVGYPVGRVKITVSYTDLTTRESQEVTI
jgi:phage baseplate assembly protein W